MRGSDAAAPGVGDAGDDYMSAMDGGETARREGGSVTVRPRARAARWTRRWAAMRRTGDGGGGGRGAHAQRPEDSITFSIHRQHWPLHTQHFVNIEGCLGKTYMLLI